MKEVLIAADPEMPGEVLRYLEEKGLSLSKVSTPSDALMFLARTRRIQCAICSLPQREGLLLTGLIKQNFPNIKVLVVANPKFEKEARQAGADGFLPTRIPSWQKFYDALHRLCS